MALTVLSFFSSEHYIYLKDVVINFFIQGAILVQFQRKYSSLLDIIPGGEKVFGALGAGAGGVVLEVISRDRDLARTITIKLIIDLVFNSS